MTSEPDVIVIWHTSNDLQKLLQNANEFFRLMVRFWQYLNNQNITTYNLELSNHPKFGEKIQVWGKYELMYWKFNKNLLKSLPSDRLFNLLKDANDTLRYSKDEIEVMVLWSSIYLD